MSRIQGSLFVLAASVLLAALGLQPASASSPGARASGDRDCSDFSSQRAAQHYFLDRGGPGSDPDRLDGDGDGRACDSLPCPCGAGGRSPSPRPKPSPPRRPDFPGRIVRVTDGDTVVVRSGSGRRFKIRLIGIDTPEVFGGLECGARAASASMKRLAPPGRRVRVKGDPTQDRRDSFGRLLAYVKTRNGPQLNIAQVRRGHAKVFVFQGNPFRQTQSFRRAARSAKRARRGVWGRCGGNFHRRVRATSTATRRNCGSLDEGLASRRCGPSTQGAGPAATIAASVRECGDLTHRFAFNITSRAVACQEARRGRAPLE